MKWIQHPSGPGIHYTLDDVYDVLESDEGVTTEGSLWATDALLGTHWHVHDLGNPTGSGQRPRCPSAAPREAL